MRRTSSAGSRRIGPRSAKLWYCDGTCPFGTLVTKLGYGVQHLFTHRLIASLLSVWRTMRSRCHCHWRRSSVGQIMPMLPPLPLAIKATTRGHEMRMGMAAMAPMRVEHRAIAPLQHFALTAL